MSNFGAISDCSNLKGAVYLALGTAWLLKNGYWAFPSASHHGPVDLVAVDRITGEVLKLDVKGYAYADRGGPPRLSADQIYLNICLLLVYPDGRCEIRREEKSQIEINWDSQARIDAADESVPTVQTRLSL